MTEATAVESRGRISINDLSIFDDAHVEPLAGIARFCHQQGAHVGVQLAHAGRKAWSDQKGHGPERPVAPSPLPFDEGWAAPVEMELADISDVAAAFRAGARRARDAGFDVLELHGAHGYLIHEFLSPYSNRREDRYGGSLRNRMRFALEVVQAVRRDWPEEAPLLVRLSATDYVDGGSGVEETVEITGALKENGVDLIDVSSGGMAPSRPNVGPGYQVPFAERVRREAGIATAAVGLITAPEHADEIIRNGRADMVVLGRELLRTPYWPLMAAQKLAVETPWPRQYLRARV